MFFPYNMNKKNIYQSITFISIVVINITTLLGGIKHHESYRIILGGIGVGLMAIAMIGQFVSNYRQKRKQTFPRPTSEGGLHLGL